MAAGGGTLHALTPAAVLTLPWAAWIDSPETNVLWGGPTFVWPLDEAQWQAHFAAGTALPFLWTVDGEAAGYVELVALAPGCFRLCRVWIAPAFRGQGWSTKMLQALLGYADSELGAVDITLGVFAHNRAARACYAGLGFQPYVAVIGACWVAAQPWTLLRLRRVKSV